MQHPKHILEQLNIRPRKKWGQNFLVHQNNVQSIVEFADPPEHSNILEIGPGLGAMTETLIQIAKQYIAVEFDPILYDYLQKTFTGKHVDFIHDDILNVSISDLFAGQTFTVIANLPYHITTPIIERLLAQRHRIESMTLLLQKEVVSRMLAQPGSKTYGRLSVWIQSLCNTQKGPTLKPGCFMPKPDVDSQVIKLMPRKTEMNAAFFDFVNILFQKRRKTIGNILKSSGYDTSRTDETILASRPEDLSIEILATLFRQTAI
ncbi:MAG: ribosomal RNA small subunit methyltransferase A [Deltaproteobacteria bacterium]|nr:ribosomal RNA small subunit methyltransferase A [Deltaproteobacteria bacterium]